MLRPIIAHEPRLRPCNTSAVDRWVVESFCRGRLVVGEVMFHVASCAACRRRAAAAWLFLTDGETQTKMSCPDSDLSFLPPLAASP